MPGAITQTAFVAAVLEIVKDQKSLEKHYAEKPAGPRRDRTSIYADAYEELMRLVEQYNGK